jgi:hypothetical protein
MPQFAAPACDAVNNRSEMFWIEYGHPMFEREHFERSIAAPIVGPDRVFRAARLDRNSQRRAA